MPKARATYFQRIARAPIAATTLDAPWAVRTAPPDAPSDVPNYQPIATPEAAHPVALVPGAAGNREAPVETQAGKAHSAFSVTSLNQKPIQPGTPTAINLQTPAPANRDGIQPTPPNRSGPGGPPSPRSGEPRLVSLMRAEFSDIPPANISNEGGAGKQAGKFAATVHPSSPSSLDMSDGVMPEGFMPEAEKTTGESRAKGRTEPSASIPPARPPDVPSPAGLTLMPPEVKTPVDVHGRGEATVHIGAVEVHFERAPLAAPAPVVAPTPVLAARSPAPPPRALSRGFAPWGLRQG